MVRRHVSRRMSFSNRRTDYTQVCSPQIQVIDHFRYGLRIADVVTHGPEAEARQPGTCRTLIVEQKRISTG